MEERGRRGETRIAAPELLVRAGLLDHGQVERRGRVQDVLRGLDDDLLRQELGDVLGDRFDRLVVRDVDGFILTVGGALRDPVPFGDRPSFLAARHLGRDLALQGEVGVRGKDLAPFELEVGYGRHFCHANSLVGPWEPGRIPEFPTFLVPYCLVTSDVTQPKPARQPDATPGFLPSSSCPAPTLENGAIRRGSAGHSPRAGRGRRREQFAGTAAGAALQKLCGADALERRACVLGFDGR